jgi:hypothetical protein
MVKLERMSTTKTIFEEQGHFWWRDEPIPASQFAPDNHVTGRLQIAHDGSARLELDGVMPSAKHPFEQIFGNNSVKPVPRPIQGITKITGKHVLLIDAVANGGAFHSSRFSYQRYFATLCLVGAQEFPRNANVPRLGQFEIDMTGFESWLGVGTLKAKRTSRTLVVKSKVIPDATFDTALGKITLVHLTDTAESEGPGLHQIKLRQYMTISVRPKTALTADEVSSECYVLQDFMILVTDSHYSLSWPIVRLARSRARYTLYFRRSASTASAPTLRTLPTRFVDLGKRFGQVLSTWKEKREAFGAGFHNYISTRRGMQLYVENTFLTLAQGLESFHRTKYGNSPPSSGLQTKIERILAQVTVSKDKSWLTKKLEHAAETTLEGRLRTIIESLPFVLLADGVQPFANQCAAIRNDLSHFGGQKTRAKSADYLLEIIACSDALSFFYHMTLLSEIGIENQHLLRWLNRGFQSHRLKATLARVKLLSVEATTPKHSEHMQKQVVPPSL